MINIITRKRHKEGIAHSVRASQGNDGRSVVSTDSSYRSEKLSVSVDAGFHHDERQKLLESDMRSPLTPAASTLDSRSALLEHRWRDVPSASADAEYALDEMDSMSGSFSWQRTGGPRNYTQTTTTTDASGTVTGVSERLSRGHAPDTDYAERLGYVRKLARSTRGVDAKLKFNYRATARDMAQLSISRTDRRLTAQGYVGAMNVVNVGYRHQLRAELSALATVSDLFNGQRTEGTGTTPSSAGYLVRAIRGPIIYVGLIYSIGSRATREPGFQYEH